MESSAAISSSTPAIDEPFAIFKVSNKYTLYDASTISYIRAKYNICGVLIGGLPQAPQQNVFLGIPLEIMPEEARLLVEKKVAFIVDDVKEHKHDFLTNSLSSDEREAYREALRKQGQAAADLVTKRTDDRKMAALQKKVDDGDWNDIPENMLQRRTGVLAKKKKKTRGDLTPSGMTPADDERNNAGSYFASPVTSTPADIDQSQATPAANSASVVEPHAVKPPTSHPPPMALRLPRSRASTPGGISAGIVEPHAVTPTTSYPPLALRLPPLRASKLPPPTGLKLPPMQASTIKEPESSNSAVTDLPTVPSSYPLYRHMHENGYFLAPGLRFGCQYMAYPGDPLRFHSHFLCNGMDWDEEFDLLDIIGGGRLGTGVKKGFLIGGQEEPANVKNTKDDKGVRAFCIEWGGM